MYIDQHHLAKRGSDDNQDDECSGFGCPNDHTRWVVLAVVLIGLALSTTSLFWWSVQRSRRRGEASVDSEWAGSIVSDPHRRRRDRRNRRRNREAGPEEADPVPTYHEDLGELDAGYYDSSGNYVAHVPPPYDGEIELPAKAVVHVSTPFEEDDQEDRLDTSTRAIELPQMRQIEAREPSPTNGSNGSSAPITSLAGAPSYDSGHESLSEPTIERAMTSTH